MRALQPAPRRPPQRWHWPMCWNRGLRPLSGRDVRFAAGNQCPLRFQQALDKRPNIGINAHGRASPRTWASQNTSLVWCTWLQFSATTAAQATCFFWWPCLKVYPTMVFEWLRTPRSFCPSSATLLSISQLCQSSDGLVSKLSF